MSAPQFFADTSFYLALMRRNDPAHERAISFARAAHNIVTTEFIIVELGNACARAEDHQDFLILVEGIRRSRKVKIEPLSADLLESGLRLMAARSDKDWSLTDCISFVVMEQYGLTEALATDRHFLQAGFTALLIQHS